MFVKRAPKTSREGFVHSIKVPRLYKVASLIIKKVVEDGGSLKDLVYSSKHKNIRGVYALVVEAIKHSKELDKLIKSSNLLKKEIGLQPWLARILITELIYGKKELKGESKPVKTILSYKNKFEKILVDNQHNSQCSSIAVKKPRYVRVNTLHYTADEVIKILRREGWTFLPCPKDYSEFLNIISNLDHNAFTKDFHIKELLVFSGTAEFHENELYQNGSICLQDKASCLPAFLLQPTSNSVVLDMCSAPGMKTTQLSAIMRNKGQIYATEVDFRRYKVLCNFVEKSGCTNVIPLNVDALNLGNNSSDPNFSWTQDVEYILVDPSCSGSGMVERTRIFTNDAEDPKRLNKLCRFQFKLLMHALTNFPKVKRVVYSTCSVHPQENEQVVEDVLAKFDKLKDEIKVKFKLAEPLKDSWVRRGSSTFEHGQYYIFADPEKDLTNGFFVAVFDRIEDDSNEATSKVSQTKRKLDNEDSSLAFLNEGEKKQKLDNDEGQLGSLNKGKKKKKKNSVT